MASLLQRLLRRQSPAILSSLTKQNSGYKTLAPSILSHRSQSIDARLSSLLPSPPPKDASEKPVLRYDYLYPIFSYGLVLNPVVQMVVTEEVDGGAGKMWADSTKKKRKRKMNEHKYKKLMKRMRNK